MTHTIVELNGSFDHAFKPEFSWLVLVILVLIWAIGYFLGKSETRIVKRNNKVTVRYASGATHAAFTILAFIASWTVIVSEHGLGIVQWFFNISGNGTGELSVWSAAGFFTFLFCVAYATLAYGIFNWGIKMSLMIAKSNYGEELEVTRHNNMIQDFKINWHPDSKKKTVKTTVAKKSSIIPAMNEARVTTR